MSDTTPPFSQPVFRSRVHRAGRSACSTSGRLAFISLALLAASSLSILPDAISRSKPAFRYDDTKKCAKRLGAAITRKDSPCVGLFTSAQHRFCGPPDCHPQGIPLPSPVTGHDLQSISDHARHTGFNRPIPALESAETGCQDWHSGNNFAPAETQSGFARSLAAQTPVRRSPFAAGLKSGCNPADFQLPTSNFSREVPA